MVPDDAARKINHLLISTTDKGVQDHQCLLEAYKEFNKYLLEKGVQKPVTLLSDGHSSRFDDEVLEFLNEEQIHLFIGPADTTGLTFANFKK